MSMAGRGGQTPRRADQGRAAGPPQQQTVIGPGARNNIRARSVVVSGTGNGVGFFEYSGTPSGSNPPVAYAVPPGVTKDPFGNTLPVSSGFVTVDSGLGLLARLTGANLQFRSTTSPPNQVPAISGPDASPAGTALVFASGKGTAGATGMFAQMLDSLQDAAQTGTGVPQLIVSSGAANNPLTTALLEVQGAIQATGLNSIIAGGNVQSSLGDIFASSGNVRADAVGKGFRVKEGANAKQGTATLALGTVVVNNTSVTAVSRIFLTAQDNSSTGTLRVSARTAGTSFTITSTNTADSGVVAWEIFEPA